MAGKPYNVADVRHVN